MRIQVSARHHHLGLEAAELSVDGHVLRCDWPPEAIEGMICFWEFTDEFLRYRGPRIFYCCEPSFYFDGFRAVKRRLRAKLRSLRMDEFAWHDHPDMAMRVVHHTVAGSTTVSNPSANRRPKAVAVVGNLGRPLFRNAGRQKRLRFIIESKCDIYGSNENWQRFRLHAWSKQGPPPTYRGACGSKTDTLVSYHACICLENSLESFYFTEKFPDAVRTGCVPIYHAHATVREKFLNGAIWVDPKDYDWKAGPTMDAALLLNREEVAATNLRWLAENANFQRTKLEPVYARLAEILQRKTNGEIHLPQCATRTRLLDEH